MIKRSMVFLIIFITTASIFCSGSSSSNNSNNDRSQSASGSGIKWGYLLPETKGIYYECEDIKGKTGPEGRFEYYEGKNVRFYIGGIELGTVKGDKIITPFSLAGYGTVPDEIQDGATDVELNNYPAARNITHFLLAINELYDNASGSYRYESLVESLEEMHTELFSKNLNFNVDDNVAQFQARLENLQYKSAWWSFFIKSCYAISLGGLNTINSTLITSRLTGLNSSVNNFNNNKPGSADDYRSLDYTGVSNPPVDGEVLTQAQLNGVWISEWDIYGDRANNDNPDSVYRDEYVQFPQKNYIVRLDGSQLEEDFICAQYQTYYTFRLSNANDMTQGRYVEFSGPVGSKQTAYASFTGYPDKIFYREGWDPGINNWRYNEYDKDHFIGVWKANNDEYQHVIIDGFYRDKIISYSSNYDHATLTFPYIDEFDDGLGDRYVGNGKYIFTKPVKGRVKVYGVFLDSDGSARPMILLRTLRKVADNTVNGAVDADFPVD